MYIYIYDDYIYIYIYIYIFYHYFHNQRKRLRAMYVFKKYPTTGKMCDTRSFLSGILLV